MRMRNIKIRCPNFPEKYYRFLLISIESSLSFSDNASEDNFMMELIVIRNRGFVSRQAQFKVWRKSRANII